MRKADVVAALGTRCSKECDVLCSRTEAVSRAGCQAQGEHRGGLAIPSQNPRLGKRYPGRPTPLPTRFTFKAISHPGFSAAPHSLKDWNSVLTIA